MQARLSPGRTSITNKAPLTANGQAGTTRFTALFSTATAGNATITNEGGRFVFQRGGLTEFRGNTATAGAAKVVNAAGQAAFALGGSTDFYDGTTAAAATFTNDAATIPGAEGGSARFFGTSNAGTATLRSAGSTLTGAGGGNTEFYNSSTAGQATLYADAGTAAFAPGGGLTYQTLSYERVAAPYGPTDLTYRVERQDSLGVPAAWSSAGVTLHSSSIDPLTGLETVIMRSETPLGAAGVMTEFLRLAVRH